VGDRAVKSVLLPVPEAALAYFAATKAKRRAEPIPERLPPGQRYPWLRSLAGSMRWRGMGADAIAAALLVENKRLGDPPLPEQEVIALADDIARRYEPEPPDPKQQELERRAEQLLEHGDTPVEPVKRERRQTAPLIISLVEFLGGSDDDAAWLVDHLAARGALIVVAGLPKVGKSTFVYGMLGALTSD
jgi:Primase C terminal 1 (PriCT-1)